MGESDGGMNDAARCQPGRDVAMLRCCDVAMLRCCDVAIP
ncbi:hypothetical protein C7S13_5036 [Burkholderia cepacia]|nr:hypothetical protein [Burkholderia cepacia]